MINLVEADVAAKLFDIRLHELETRITNVADVLGQPGPQIVDTHQQVDVIAREKLIAKM